MSENCFIFSFHNQTIIDFRIHIEILFCMLTQLTQPWNIVMNIILSIIF